MWLIVDEMETCVGERNPSEVCCILLWVRCSLVRVSCILLWVRRSLVRVTSILLWVSCCLVKGELKPSSIARFYENSATVLGSISQWKRGAPVLNQVYLI
jgi:hypothetical protein